MCKFDLLIINHFKMKNIFIALTLTLSFYVTSAQTDRVYNSATYINDVAASEVPRFIELHKSLYLGKWSIVLPYRVMGSNEKTSFWYCYGTYY